MNENRENRGIARKETTIRNQKNYKRIEHTVRTGKETHGSTRTKRIQQLSGEALLVRKAPGSAARDPVGAITGHVPVPHTQALKHQRSEPHPSQAPSTNMDEIDQPNCDYPARFAFTPSGLKDGIVAVLTTASAAPMAISTVLGVAIIVYRC